MPIEPTLDQKKQNSFTNQKNVNGNRIVKQHPQGWFEMKNMRNHPMSVDSWVTVKSIRTLPSEGCLTEEHHSQKINNVGSVMFPITNHESALKFGWDNQAYLCRFDGEIYSSIKGFSSNELQEKRAETQYLPCGYYRRDGVIGFGLVIEQHVNSQENPVWHLHQDFVVALNLIREDDKWVRPEEGYIEVARLSRNSEGKPEAVEVRREHLLDYLSARKVNLYLYSFHSRRELTNDYSHVRWKPGEEYVEEEGMRRWEGRIIRMSPYKLFPEDTTEERPISSKDAYEREEVPGPESNSVRDQVSNMQTADEQIYKIIGELWCTEVIEAGDRSERVLDDEPISVPFIIDSTGRTETDKFLKKSNLWLHFRPEVINDILGHRGAFIDWCTSYTGGIGLAPDHSVHFGINESGHVNVFAKDIAQLPVWQRRIWSGFNITPDGEVSKELLASQFEANPASTIAPEVLLRDAYININDTSNELLGKPLFRERDEYCDQLFSKCHRLRAIDRPSLYALAKDLYRLTIERVDQSVLRVVAEPQRGEKWQSIRHLQEVLEICRDAQEAQEIVSSIKGLNKLRQADAHRPSNNIERSIRKAGIIETGNPINEAYQLLQHFAKTLNRISEILREAPIGQ